MGSLFDSLHIGYSGLNASQIGINTTGHNISNAETPGYSRQRVVNATTVPLEVSPGLRGNGVQVETITRIFDQFVFDRYSATSQNKEYSDFMRGTLEELSTYFPDIDGVGIKSDMQAYFDHWQSLADNPDNDAIKVALAQQTTVMADHIGQTYDQIRSLQDQMNEQLRVSIEEVNRIAEEIAHLNKSIGAAEAGGDNANDLRDRRNQLELSLSKLIGSKVFESNYESDISIDSHMIQKNGSYNINVAGFNIVDGATFHPIGVDNVNNPEGFYDLYYERQDGHQMLITDNLSGGKVGAILELRGSNIDPVTGIPQNGILQETLNQLDALAQGIIESTNNLYAQSATQYMRSNPTDLAADESLITAGLPVKSGSFEIQVYDIDGNPVATRTIKLDLATTIDDGTPESIISQITSPKDDNADNNPNNDVDDFLSSNTVHFTNGELVIDMEAQFKNSGYTFAILDSTSGGYNNGTNFAGALGLSRYFDGDSARTMELTGEYRDNPTHIRANQANDSGDNAVALSMVQLQFEKMDYKVGDIVYNDTAYGFYDSLATGVGTKTNAAILSNDTVTAQFSAIELEYTSISKVSIDEEMTNLIKYQTAYGAAAKVISTVDQMMNTLLGIKQ